MALPVSTVFQLASRDYKNGYFRGPDLLFWWTLRDIKRGFCAHSFHVLWLKGAFLCTCSLVALPVSTVFQLASRDYKNGYFRGPDLLFWWTLRDIKRGFCAHSFHPLLWKGLFYALARWWPCQCRLCFSWLAETIKTDILEVLICFVDGLWETSNVVFVPIHFIYYCEWGFLCTCSLVALPVSTVFQLASRDYKNGYFRGPDLLCWWTLRDIKRGFCAHSFHLLLWKGLFYALARWWPCQCRLCFSWPAETIKTDIFEVLICFVDGLWEISNVVFVLIHFIYYCEWGFFMHLLVGGPASVDCVSVG